MSEIVEIVCLVPTSVRIEDLSVTLSGRGSIAPVLAASASSSSDLRLAVFRRQVRIRNTGGKAMRVWPFSRPAPSPAPSPAPVFTPEQGHEITKALSGINEKLESLLGRPVASPPEVVAAHLKAVGLAQKIPQGLPGSDSHPTFIPSSIVPKDVSVQDLKVTEGTVDSDVNDTVEALRSLKRGKR